MAKLWSRSDSEMRAFAPGRKVEEFARDEDGAIIVLSLFIFLMMLMIAGLGVDLMRMETKRAKIQATTDAAVLAAAKLEQTMDPEATVRDYFRASGLDPDSVTVNVEIERANGIDISDRTVTASTRIDMDTFFMHLVGVEMLSAGVGSMANERYENVEISLVLDISGSMNGTKMTDLKRAAKEFINQVVDETRTVGVTSVSIIPYNHVVVAGEEFLSYMNADGETVTVSSPAGLAGALTSYQTSHSYSSCIRFRDEDFYPEYDDMASDYPRLRAISPDEELERVSHFSRYGLSGQAPISNYRECDENRSPILLHSTSIADLEAHIDGMRAGGNTAIDVGMKWAVALLDPALRPVINDMIDDDILSDLVVNRPGPYATAGTRKIIVLMTDGANTSKYDIQDEFKNGTTNVWYSEIAGTPDDDGDGFTNDDLFPVSSGGRPKTSDDGYFIEFPDNPADQRFFRPENLVNQADGEYFSATSVPSDLVQLDRHELYARMSVADANNLLYGMVDFATARANAGAAASYGSGYRADDRLSSICEAARQNNDIVIYTIAFQAPQRGQDAMQDCAAEDGYYYPVSQTNISQAFSSIAGSINQLRLTQ